jgi:hypothetical protein
LGSQSGCYRSHDLSNVTGHIPPWRFALATAAALGLAAFAGITSVAGTAQAASPGPCDIYAGGGTPCVAAYSTVRALYHGYFGPMYQVTRASDDSSKQIWTSRPGGYADAAAQTAFCAGTTCTISRIYDQSGHDNTLGIEPIGGNGSPDVGAIANALPVTIDGHLCCFDFGNAETTNTDTGNGHMDAINFGTECWFTPCTGSGPWVQADLENGLFMGGNGSDTGNVGNASKFVTAIMNNNGRTDYTIADANAQSGGVHVEYSGPLPDIGGYTPMNTEGSILLGTGGDDSNGSDGSFFEGVVTAGYPSAAVDSAVQANIVAAGYQAVTPAFPAAGTDYTITNVNSATEVQPDGCGTANGTGIELSSASGTTCQRWTFTSAGNGHYTITNVASGTVLDSVDCGEFDGTLTDLWSSLGNACQEWDVTAVGSHYTISNVGNGMVLDAEDCEVANGTVVRQWAQLDNVCQQWNIAPTSGT